MSDAQAADVTRPLSVPLLSARRTARFRGVRSAVSRLILVLVGLSLPLILLEAALRQFGPILPGSYASALYLEPHPRYGRFNIPNTGGFVRTSEFTSRVDFNSRGLREREIPLEKPIGTRRILVLGDSFVQGSEVSVDTTVTRQLETLLNERNTGQTEVINAGVGGFGTAQEELLLKHEAIEYNPDVVVLVFYVGNDVANNGFRIQGNPTERTKPFYVLDNDKKLRLLSFTYRHPREEGWLETLRRESLVFGVLDTGVFGKAPTSPSGEDDDLDQFTRVLLGRHIPVYRDTLTRAWSEGWDVTEVILDSMRDVAAAHGAQFLLVDAPSKWEIYPDDWAELRSRHRLAESGWDLDGPRRRLAAIAERDGISYLDVRPALRASAPNGPRLFYRNDVHWTPAGHAVVARALADRLKADRQ